jgi:hypothetical protein
MKNKNNNEFFDLLLLNDEKELEKFLLSKGKVGKPICPIMFIKNENGDDNNDYKV